MYPISKYPRELMTKLFRLQEAQRPLLGNIVQPVVVLGDLMRDHEAWFPGPSYVATITNTPAAGFHAIHKLVAPSGVEFAVLLKRIYVSDLGAGTLFRGIGGVNVNGAGLLTGVRNRRVNLGDTPRATLSSTTIATAGLPTNYILESPRSFSPRDCLELNWIIEGGAGVQIWNVTALAIMASTWVWQEVRVQFSDSQRIVFDFSGEV